MAVGSVAGLVQVSRQRRRLLKRNNQKVRKRCGDIRDCDLEKKEKKKQREKLGY